MRSTTYLWLFSIASVLPQPLYSAFCPCYSRPTYTQCKEPAVEGSNPSIAEWNQIFLTVSGGAAAWGSSGPPVGTFTAGCNRPQPLTAVAATFPCEVLKAMAMEESTWQQFCSPTLPPSQVGLTPRTIMAVDCGTGIFQVTDGMETTDPQPVFDRYRVVSEPLYSAATGAAILRDKWESSRCVGDNQPNIVEDWYSALWAYNGNDASKNNPSNPNLSSTRPVYHPGVSTPSDGWTYQERIWGWMEYPPSSEHWAALQAAYPDRAEIDPSAARAPKLNEPHCKGPTDCTGSRPVHPSSCLSGGASPSPPSGLQQHGYGGGVIPIGGSTNAGTVAFSGIVGNSGGPPARLAVEIKRIGVAFDEQGLMESSPVNGGTSATICVPTLVDGQYHWQARARDSAGRLSAWTTFGGNSESSSDFIVAATLCALCSSSSSITNIGPLVDKVKCGGTLGVSLSATPSSGSAPLNDVDLTASVSGTESGAITYIFYCDRADGGTDILPGEAARYTNVTTNPITVPNICDYGMARTYSAKVIVQRGASAAQATMAIPVTGGGNQGPSVTTSGSAAVTQTSASLSMSVTPNGSSTSVWFDWGPTSSFCCSTTQQVVSAAGGPTLLSMALGDLTCNTTYFFRARAANVSGSASGGTLSFKTSACGSSQPVQLVADPSFEAGNNGWWVASPAFYINRTPTFPNPRTGSYYAFVSNADGSSGNNLQGGMISPPVTVPANTGAAELAFWYSVTSQESTSSVFDTLEAYLVRPGNQLTLLTTVTNQDQSGTQYRERRVGVGSQFFGQSVQIFFRGTTDSSLPTTFRVDDVTLTATPTTASPTVTTQGADQITPNSARLNMMVNPNGASTTIWFRIEAGDATPDDETEHLAIGSGGANLSTNISVFGLECGTQYFFRAYASNTQGTNNGSVLPFTTPTCSGPPRADTDQAVSIMNTSAVLTAEVDANGSAAQAWFAWGASQSLGRESARLSIGFGVGFVSFSQQLVALNCDTDYFFQIKVSNQFGQASGSIGSFRTSPCASLPQVSISAIDDTATEAGLTSGAIRVTRTGSTSQALNVAFALSGTASNGVDYDQISAPLTIGAGSASADIVIHPKQDSVSEATETVVLSIQPQSTYNITGPSSAAVSILDDDGGGGGACAVTLLSPLGGEVVVKGSPTLIKWSATSGCIGYVVYLFRGGQWDAFLSTFITGSEFLWTPEAWIVPGTNLQVQVVGLDSQGGSDETADISNMLSLVNPSLLPTVIYEDTADGDGPTNYSSEGWGLTTATAHSPVFSHTDSPANYENNINKSLFTPWLDISGRRSVSLTFWHRYELAGNDLIQIWARTATGPWLFQWAYTGQQLSWMPVTIDLPAFVGQPSIQIAFQLLTDASGTADGWYIDDIKVFEGPATSFFTVTPCRAVDTRPAHVPLLAGPPRSFSIAGTCGVPAGTTAASLNVTVVSPTGPGVFVMFPPDRDFPNTSVLSFGAGQIRAAHTVLPLSPDGTIAASLQGVGQADILLDVDGYFAPTYPLGGFWQGTVAGFRSDLNVQQGPGIFTARLSMDGANAPIELLEIRSVAYGSVVLYRPADDAELRLSLVKSTIQQCLVGDYVEGQTTRPISLCKGP